MVFYCLKMRDEIKSNSLTDYKIRKEILPTYGKGLDIVLEVFRIF
jgi:hypothetical protein